MLHPLFSNIGNFHLKIFLSTKKKHREFSPTWVVGFTKPNFPKYCGKKIIRTALGEKKIFVSEKKIFFKKSKFPKVLPKRYESSFLAKSLFVEKHFFYESSFLPKSLFVQKKIIRTALETLGKFSQSLFFGPKKMIRTALAGDFGKISL